MRYFYVALLFFLMPFSRVFAVDVTREYIPNTEYHKTVNGVEQHGSFPMFKIDNEVLYCIEPGIPINSLSYLATTDYIIPDMLKHDLELIAYYGYNYPSHRSELYLMATQKLIWEALGSIDVYYTFTSSNNKIPIDSYVDEIKRLINTYYSKPSFDNVTLSGFIGSEYSLYDYNNEISNYTIINKGGNDVVISSNNLNIKLFADEDILLSKSNGKITTIYSNANSQKLALFGISNNISDAKINVNIIYGTINISVTSQNSIPLNDIVYEVTNNSGYKKLLTTNVNGIASLSNLNQGAYEIRQIKPLNGHKRDDNIYYAYISNKAVINDISFVSEIDYKKVTINKYTEDITTNTCNIEPNISFGIYESDLLIKTIVTDAGGTAKVDLPYGKYIIKQLTSVTGYDKASDITLIINDKSNDEITINLYSYRDSLPSTNSDNSVYIYLGILIVGIILLFIKRKHEN